MKIGELVVINKEKYTKAYIIENDKITNEPVFTLLTDDLMTGDMISEEAKDYFLLDIEGVEEIFGNSEKLGLKSEDKILIIGI